MIFAFLMTRLSIPEVMGLETELGIQSSLKDDSMETKGIVTDLSKIAFRNRTEIELSDPDFWLTNGGRIYFDQGLWEICTPEVRNIKDLLTWQRAMERIIVNAASTNPNLTVYKNNLDSGEYSTIDHENTWGSHMNYTTILGLSRRVSLILPAVLEKLLCGSGNLKNSGRFDIAQRARKIGCIHPEIACLTHPEATITENRVNLLDERNERSQGRLFHHTSNDSNMLDLAEWLKVGFMRNMIALAERNSLPSIDYICEEALHDLVHLTTIPNIEQDPKTTLNNWYLPSMSVENRSALALLRRYNTRAREVLFGIDSETNYTIDLTDEVISSLERFGEEPALLYGTLDWVTKRLLLTEKMKAEGLSPDNDQVRSVNLEYHSLKRDSLFNDLNLYGGINRITSEEEVRRAMIEPPNNSRAHVRGKIVGKAVAMLRRNLEQVDWEELSYRNELGNLTTMNLYDARENYSEELPAWLSEINALKT